MLKSAQKRSLYYQYTKLYKIKILYNLGNGFLRKMLKKPIINYFGYLLYKLVKQTDSFVVDLLCFL